VVLVEPVHPKLVPVTVYVVVDTGLSIKGFEVPRPPLHKDVVAPPAVKVVGKPEHTGLGDAESVITGLAFTVIVMLAVPVHPKLVPVTV
jgi:hypothetical protein